MSAFELWDGLKIAKKWDMAGLGGGGAGAGQKSTGFVD
jgi:hypothetical protein